METTICLRALHMAVKNRQPAHGLIHHSDRGTQYTSKEYRDALTEYGIQCSMSRRAQCWDNAAAESFFARFKEELFPMTRWETKAQALAKIPDYIERYYNTKRIKSRLSFIGPVEHELKCGMTDAAA